MASGIDVSRYDRYSFGAAFPLAPRGTSRERGAAHQKLYLSPTLSPASRRRGRPDLRSLEGFYKALLLHSDEDFRLCDFQFHAGGFRRLLERGIQHHLGVFADGQTAHQAFAFFRADGER